VDDRCKRGAPGQIFALASAAERGDQILDPRRLVLEHRLFGFDGLDEVLAQSDAVGGFLRRQLRPARAM